MGNEIFYCIGCGSRVSGPDFGGDRSHCAGCLGISGDPTPRPGRESSKRIRKPSSGAIAAVVVRPCPPVTVAPKPSRPLVIGGLCLAGALLFALGSLFSPSLEKPTRLISQPPAPQEVEKTTRMVSQEPEKPIRVNPPDAEKTTTLVSQEPKREAAAPTAQAELEAKADYFLDVIQEAAVALADEGRIDDALAQIKSFPPQYRNTRAWNNLEGLRRQLEARARSK